MTDVRNYNKALSYAYLLFKYRPRSRNELQERLKLKGYSADVIEEIIAEFEQKHLIDDKRFANLWVLNRIQSKPSSLASIRQQLIEKGINSEIIDDVVSQLKGDFDEYEIAKSLAEKRLRLLSGVKKLAAKKRVFDYLRRRGFSSDVCYRAIKEISPQPNLLPHHFLSPMGRGFKVRGEGMDGGHDY